MIVEVRKLRQAMDGEKVVGQFLESLREQGYHVFHDLIGTGFNIDHVLIGPAGVFTVEGEAKITFDGEAVRIGTFEPDRNPIIQASAQTGWLRELLKDNRKAVSGLAGDLVSGLVHRENRTKQKVGLGA